MTTNPNKGEQMFDVKKHTGFTEKALEAAFKLVADKDHWKNPIDIVIARPDMGLEVIDKAVEFYTATAPVFTPVNGNLVHVEADGYYAGPAGDH